MDNLKYDIDIDDLNKMGFTIYYDHPETYRSNNMRGEVTPPDNTKYMFMGCGKANTNVIDVGAIVAPDELFDPKDYQGRKNAKSVRGFYVYDSSNCMKPIGFSGYQDININCHDNISDKSRMTFFTGIICRDLDFNHFLDYGI